MEANLVTLIYREQMLVKQAVEITAEQKAIGRVVVLDSLVGHYVGGLKDLRDATGRHNAACTKSAEKGGPQCLLTWPQGPKGLNSEPVVLKAFRIKGILRIRLHHRGGRGFLRWGRLSLG